VTDDREPDDETVVEVAATAATDLILERYSSSAVRDLDVVVRFEEGVLDVSVYIDVPDADDTDETADEAALAAQAAVDELLDGSEMPSENE
jgi:hypothetical protein